MKHMTSCLMLAGTNSSTTFSAGAQFTLSLVGMPCLSGSFIRGRHVLCLVSLASLATAFCACVSLFAELDKISLYLLAVWHGSIANQTVNIACGYSFQKSLRLFLRRQLLCPLHFGAKPALLMC